MQWDKPDHQYRLRYEYSDGRAYYLYFKSYNEARVAKNKQIKAGVTYYHLIEHQGTRRLRVYIDGPIPNGIMSIIKFHDAETVYINSELFIVVNTAAAPTFQELLAAHNIRSEFV